MDLSPDEDNFQGRLLHQAALWDNVELLQELIASGAEVDGRDANGRSALHAAALCERSRCLPVLCAAGAQLDAQSDHRTGGKTALHLAAERGHVENVVVLVGAGAGLGARDAAGRAALALAEARSHRHAAQALRDARDTQEYKQFSNESEMLHRFRAAAHRSRKLAHEATDAGHDEVGETDDAYEVKDYFPDDFTDPWREGDSLERERLCQHAQLRELVTRGEAQQLRTKLGTLGTAAGLIVNLTPGGANTLLYVASEAGQTATVSALLDAGADGRAHPVTKYSPLYIACYHGHADIVRLLLGCFPEAVQQETVEKWLPIHAACIGGHAALVTLLLEYPYPESVLKTYSEASGQWQYKAAFDVNACDVSGQTALYVACTLGNLALVEALLAHTVPCLPLDQSAPPEPPPPVVSPQRGISRGIHAIVSKLTGNSNNHEAAAGRVCRAVRTDAWCAGDSCVSVCARMGHTKVLQRLLAAGADPNAPAHPPTDTLSDVTEGIRESRRRSRSAGPGVRHAPSPSPATRNGYDADRSGGWTALAVAARARNVQVAEMLLAHGAQDPQCRALRECARHSLTDLVDKLLATKAYPDPEYKLNKSTMAESVFSGRSGDCQLTYSALCPSTAVMINWRELRCQLAFIRPSWMVSAALRVNSKLGGAAQALHAVTRLDVSNNDLRLLPHQLFSMLSLRYLNAAQNKLERLPTASDVEDEPRRRGRRPRPRPQLYTAPLLQEIYLQDNRLEELPPGLFSLAALTSLDVSNNKLRALPPSLWAAPALRDLNAALNHLKDLPRGDQVSGDSGQSQESPTDSTSQMSASPSNGTQFGFSQSSTSRSPSIEQSECGEWDDEDGIPLLGNRAGNAVWSEARRVGAWRGTVGVAAVGVGAGGGGSPLQGLNLAHNQFTCVPPTLACRAPSLTRLNMAYNSLRSMSYVTSYPTTLRQLDLSHNEITCWPSLPQVESFGASEGDPLACYCGSGPPRAPRPRSGGSVRAQLLSAACPARGHLRLEALRTLILANNLLTRIQLTTDDDGLATQDQSIEEQDEDWTTSAKGRLVFPWLSMLDVSCNLLRAIPPALHLLNNLSVLNISGNKDITELPPQMGLLSRLWNLNTVGCSLVEPLRSMVASGRYKSMDIVGYLKSVLQEARPYSTMKLMIVGLQGIGKTSLLECLRQESGIQHRRKPTDHWAKRMGNKSSRRGNLSTVGVDIGSWVYDKARSSRGPLTFRTWDFGGQQEYYATHQYFLSRRSLYLVVWKATDGRKGLAGALNWLRSIQARAPGSPVIMVATHYDQVANCCLAESENPESLQRLIRSAIMAAPDADKLGLPRVMDTLEVSCSTRHNIRLLADIIYSVAFSVKPPGSKEPLLEQRVPATYLALEECVTTLAADLKEPVLRHDEYKKLVNQYMQQKNHRMFRDAAELHQATMFLHENGVLLHYDDATLKELYFLRPQWLCDVLAHVVTVREINPFANQGIMKVEDLAHVFKASPQLWGGEEAGALGVSLLTKFELALCWDARVLLVPPLLPRAEPALPQLPVRSRAWSGPGRCGRRAWAPGAAAAPGLPRPATPRAVDVPRGPDTPRATDSPTLIQEAAVSVGISGRSGGVGALRRLLVLSYVPCGFWPRLVTRLLADAALNDAPHALYTLPAELEVDETTAKAVDLQWGWKLWKTGLRLVCGGLELASLSERPPLRDPLIDTRLHHQHDDTHYTRLRVRQDGTWCELNVQRSAIVQLELPALVCVVRRDDGLPLAGYQSISLEPNPEILAKVLAMISDHVDLLLEDWYPSLGTRFVHTSEGRCLITRVVPCPECLKDPSDPSDPCDPADPLPPTHDHLAQAFRRLEMGGAEPPRPRVSEESRTSDGDSGVGAESNASSRLGSVEGMVSAAPQVTFGWTVEECILAACSGKTLHCPHHGLQELRHIAPDTLLLDVEESRRARWEDIWRGPVAGRGAFGTVLEARWRPPGGPATPAALKALQPVQPPSHTDLPALQAYKAAMCRWERDPAGAACRAYLGLRQELSILRRVAHPHIVPLIAVCAAPLALLLQLAPMGALDGALRQYRGCGKRVPGRVARALALQVARALEYLHAARIVYRDLKSENVLVWRLPRPQEVSAAELSSSPIDVHVKLADYGISRLAPPSGTKGFGGTEGFMAPEIMRYNGEEEYNEKVDCFSYGMLLYEIVTTRQPFEGHEAVKEAVLEGARPTLTPRELEYPCCLLETMRRCWAGAPEHRPSAAALVSAACAPEYTALMDACAARAAHAAACLPVLTVTEEGAGGWEVWFGGGEPERVHTLLTTTAAFTHQYTIRIPPDHAQPVFVSAMCRVGASMWLGDTAGRLSVYSAATCALSWSVTLHGVVGGAAAAVAALEPLPGLHRVALALATGRLFLVSSQRPEAEGSFVLTELGTATELCCLAALPTPHGCEVWAGGDGLSSFAVRAGGVCSAERLSAARLTLLAASHPHACVLAYTYPGVCITQWTSEGATGARLDVSKLVPCSETLQSIAIEQHLPQDKCRVTALCVLGNEVYVGTAWGCLVVADVATLRPITVFRPYEEDVRAIVPLLPPRGCGEGGPMLATFGSGYRPLLNRYAPSQSNTSTTHAGHHCLLWRAQHWLPD